MDSPYAPPKAGVSEPPRSAAPLLAAVGVMVVCASVGALLPGPTTMRFIAGSILGTYAAVWLRFRAGSTAPTGGWKFAVGGSLAVAAVVGGLLGHLVFRPLPFPEVSLPIAAVGALVFPFVIGGSAWKAFAQTKGADAPKAAGPN